VLNDVALRDPITGLPFGGQIETSLGLPLEMRTLAAGAIDFKSGIGPTRSCIAGFLSKQSLIDRGLSEKPAVQFFKKPITLRFGSTGFASSASSLQFAYGMRVYGD
jgi:hypothetical protein